MSVARRDEDGAMQKLVALLTPTVVGLATPPATGVIIDRYSLGGTP
jgi:hypothetical protein